MRLPGIDLLAAMPAELPFNTIFSGQYVTLWRIS